MKLPWTGNVEALGASGGNVGGGGKVAGRNQTPIVSIR